MDTYFQCMMRRGPGGAETTIGWIEARGAKVGARVELLDLERPQDFWTVAEVWQPPMDKAALQAKQGRDRNAFASIGKVR